MVHGERGRGQPRRRRDQGRASPHPAWSRPAGARRSGLRLTDTRGRRRRPFDGTSTQLMSARRGEADEFYADVLAGDLSEDERLVAARRWPGCCGQAVLRARRRSAGWPSTAPTRSAPDRGLRNHDWRHLIAEDIISMPDKWEYPWFAAWDLAFHAVAARRRRHRRSPSSSSSCCSTAATCTRTGSCRRTSGTSATSTRRCTRGRPGSSTRSRRRRTGQGDRAFLESAFHKLMRNFGWWLNRKDADGRNIFQGGFLGLDNIGVFDRSAPLPTGGRIDQADGTAWMALYCQNMFQIAIELAAREPGLRRAGAVPARELGLDRRRDQPRRPDGVGLWDEEDGFFYDVLRRPGRQLHPAEGALARRADAAGRRDRHRRRACRDEFPELVDGVERVPGPAPGGDRRAARPRRQRDATGPVAVRAVRRGPAAPDPGPDARRGGVPRAARHPRRYRGATPSTRTC